MGLSIGIETTGEEINEKWPYLGLTRSDGKTLYRYIQDYANGENYEALESFTKAIEKQPEVLILALQEHEPVSEFEYVYFRDGWFLWDLQDLLNVSYYAKEHGAEKIRLYIG